MSVSSVKNHLKKLYPYQKARINELTSIYGNFPKDMRAFLQMPTGTGKTFTALYFCLAALKNTGGTVYWVVHQKNLATQSCKDFFKLFKEQGGVLTGEGTGEFGGIKFVFSTWQSLRGKLNRKESVEADMLIIDEAHYGSSGNRNGFSASDHKSFKKILRSKLFARHLYVTATPWDLNEEVYPKLLQKTSSGLGPKRSRVAVLTMKEAKDLQLVCDVQFRVFHSADTLRLKKLNSDEEFEIHDSNTKDLANQLVAHDVNLKHADTKKALQRAIVEATLEGVLRLEGKNGADSLPAMLVFCEGIDSDDPRSIKSVRKSLIKKIRKIFGAKTPVGVDLIQECHSRMPSKKGGEEGILEAFAVGKHRIMLVDSMAQEGFDYPKLEVIVDLAPAFNNDRRRVQRVGRIVRPKAACARYYYADTVSNYVISKGRKMEINKDTKDQLGRQIVRSDMNQTSATPDELAEVFANAALALAKTDQRELGQDDVPLDVAYFGTDDVPVTLDDDESEEIDNQPEFDNSDRKANFLEKKRKTIIHCSSIGYVIKDASLKASKVVRFKQASLYDIIDNVSDSIPWGDITEAQAIEHLVKTDTKERAAV